jgi:hypothetical protein
MVSNIEFCLGVWISWMKVKKFAQLYENLLNWTVCGVLVLVV